MQMYFIYILFENKTTQITENKKKQKKTNFILKLLLRGLLDYMYTILPFMPF